jgi:hypothetical protein
LYSGGLAQRPQPGRLGASSFFDPEYNSGLLRSTRADRLGASPFFVARVQLGAPEVSRLLPARQKKSPALGRALKVLTLLRRDYF